MNVPQIPPGLYIIAVSGGVDSMVLLHVLSKQSNVRLVVAHVDHGIREDSYKDRVLVEQTAKNVGLQFEYIAANLGPDTSEATARTVRYDFLRRVMEKYNAKAIITAHHQDDRMETAIINILRGTGRKGLSSLTSGNGLLRPLLGVPKKEVLDYAKQNDIVWREDSTNTNTKFLRNYVRHNIVPRLSGESREQLLSVLNTISTINNEVEAILNELANTPVLNRKLLWQLDHAESTELIAHWLRANDVRDFNALRLTYATVRSKTLFSGKISINKRVFIEVNAKNLALVGLDR